MNPRRPLMTLAICLALVVPALPGSQALAPQTSSQAATLALEAPAQATTAGPTPTPDTPPPPTGEGAEGAAVPDGIAGLPGVTKDWWQQVQAQILGEAYAFGAERAEHGAPIHRGTNPEQRLDLTFAGGSLRLAPANAGPKAAAAEPSWTWELRPTGLGYEGDVRPLPAATGKTAKGNRLELRRAGLAEWYVNDERGLEQGFTLDAPPAGGANAGTLVLEMALDTGLVPVLGSDQAITDGQAIEFTRADGNVVLLRYSDLAVYDAGGQPLPAHLELSGRGRGAAWGTWTLRIVVDAAGAAYPLTVDPLIATPSWTAVGENAGDNFGISAAAGDVNGDGYADLAVGTEAHDAYRGKVYVYHGSPAGLGTTPAWTAVGENVSDRFACSVATGGDVNGDGYDDLAVGASVYDGGRGKVYVYHGSPAGLGESNRPADWAAAGENAPNWFALSVASGGDVNGDGYDDLAVGALAYDDGRGKVYVYHGSPAGLGESNRPADWTAVGENVYHGFAGWVATAGDVNGDGFSDLAVGASAYDASRGKVYVYHGSPAGLGESNRPADWAAVGENVSDRFARSVAGAGDVNGDGYDDLAVGAALYDAGRGKVYVYHGSPAGLGTTPAWAAVGEKVPDRFAWSVATGGDVNGDGFSDLAVGALDYDGGRGKVYVYHGSPAGLGESNRPADWAAVGENSVSDLFAWSVATAGDVNGDGFSDLAVGASAYDAFRGKVYVYHGTAWGLTPAFDWAAGGEATADQFGYAVGTAGDVNGDGFSDLAVGAWGYDGGRGRVYLFPGSPAGLDTAAALVLTGESPGDRFGRSVAAAGDVNGDGYADLAVGAPYNDEAGTSAGKAYLFYGSAGGLQAEPGWTAAGVQAHDNLGASVAGAGSVNGDGYADLVVGADGYPGGSGNGKAYVFYGSATGLAAAPAWAASGEHPADHFGYAVGTAGDVNGDGCDDLVAGSWGYAGYRGKVYVYHGSSPAGPGDAPAWTATGEAAGDYLGWSVGTAGDVNGDGYGDVAVGAWGCDGGRGRAYVYRGSAQGLRDTAVFIATGQSAGDGLGYAVATAGDVDGDGYADLVAGAQGYATAGGAAYLYRGGPDGLGTSGRTADWTGSGARPGDRYGAAVGTAGDVNGDGFSDLVAGAWGYDDPANTNAGRVYVYHGSAPGLAGTAASTVPGQNPGDELGYALASAGDVNGDGHADVAVGAWGCDGTRGRAYVYHGSVEGLGGTAVFTATGESAGDRLGYAVATAGDVNGDGYGDLVIGAPYNSEAGTSAGKAYVYHGSANGLRAEPAWTAVGETGYDYYGYAVASAGDVNGDGYGDLVVGAWRYDGYRGKAYVYYGSADGLSAEPAWTVVGENLDDYYGYAVASAGDVNGDGYDDLVVGAAHNNGNRGKAYVYYGSAKGLKQPVPPATNPAPDWSASGDMAPDYFGEAVATAGDVNGDGYADLVVGAGGGPYAGVRGKAYVYHGSPLGLDVAFSVLNGENDGDHFGSAVAPAGDVNGDGYADLAIGAAGSFTNTGQVYLYQGSASGLNRSYEWRAGGGGVGDRFGRSLAAAGDVNGDGYADLAIGAPGSITTRGKIYLYQGNDGGGRPALATQVRGDISGVPVQPWGPSYSADSFGVWLQAVHPLGRGRAMLQVQACRPGASFGDAMCLDQTSNKWTTVSGAGGVVLKKTVHGLAEGTLYRWRARVVYDSPLYTHGPWRRVTAQALEGDVRSTRPPADLSITKTMAPTLPLGMGAPITYTIAFHSNGPARGVVISDVLSSDISGVLVSSSGAAITDTGHQPCCVWDVQDLEAGQGGVITIAGVAQADRFVNTAIITGTSPDPNPANNSATVQTHVRGLLYVDADARGANDGLSWASAYTDLQDALAEARPGDQIWIASGVYRPTAGSLRTASFGLVSGVELHGGFAGTERWLYERPAMAPPTVLSGDIGTQNNPDDNVYHVVTATAGVTETAVLEGVTIAGGNADGTGANGEGGGLYSTGASPTLINVAFVGNAAGQGGGIYAQGGSPVLVDVAFSGNSAETRGGGMYNTGSTPALTNVTFSGNAAVSGGGLFCAGGSAVTLTNAILWGNRPDPIVRDAQSSCSATYSDVQGDYPGSGNLAADPRFADADGADDIAGTLDDDLRIYTTFRHPSPVIDRGSSAALPTDTWDLDGDGDTAEHLALDLSGRDRLIGFTGAAPKVDMGAYEATVLDALAAGQALFEEGQSFRLENLQLLSSDTMVQALQNYANLNDGEWYNAFCADYNQIDANCYCPQSDPSGVRNTLLDAVDLYRVAVGWPTEVFTTARGVEIPVRDTGGQGVMAALSEIANVHLIFGNEFLVDATDYRFSTQGIPNADQIISRELDELAQAERQFELILDLAFRALADEDDGGWGVAAYCDGDQFEQIGMASNLMMSTLNETAARYYMLGNSRAALDVYNQAWEGQYLQLMALADLAKKLDEDYLQNGSWEMLNNLSQLRERAQALNDNLDFFGFAPGYVPLQGYEQLLVLTQGPTGDTGLLGTAYGLEDQAREAQRTFDANASAMATELDNLTVELNNQLFELCGQSEDDCRTCRGGLMLQNLDDLDAASLRVGLALLRAQNLTEQIRIEEERAGHVITVRLALGQELSAAELAMGVLRANKTTTADVSSSEDRFHAGAEVAVEAYLQQEYKFGTNPGWENRGGFKESVTAKGGYEHAWSWVDSTTTTWDPNEAQIGQWESVQALKQAEAEAEIEGASSEALVRNLLLQQAEAVEEFQIAMAEFNKLAAEHNYLAERRSRLLNMREQAINRVANHNSHLLNPAYRIWRDSLTTQSLAAHNLAAQFAYLTARAAEYELLTPYPNLRQIFRARTANDIRLFLDGLDVWVQALDLPGELNRYPYTISLARDVWGLTDEYLLNLYPGLSQEELAQKRYEEFQRLLAANIQGDRLQVWFSTALDQERAEGQYLFSPNIWNNRIAGVGAPLAGNEGVRANIVTRQGGAVDGVEVVLIHGGSAGGAEAYRNVENEIVYYDPDTAVPVGYVLPAGLDPENTTVVLRPGINGAGAIVNGGLINLSVASSSWTLGIPAESRGNLRYKDIEDIEITLDSTGRALPGMAAQAARDALLLQAGLEMEPVKVAPRPRVAAAAPLAQSVTPPSVSGEIGGAYSGYVMVTSPVTIAIQVLDLNLWNAGGTLTGTIDATKAALYPADVEITGTAGSGGFSLASEAFTTTVASRLVTQTLALDGYAEEGGDILKAVYTGTIEGLLPEPILVYGKFTASRPGVAGSERLELEAGSWTVQPGASTPITATLYDEAMAPITETRTITFTADLGTVTPAIAQTVDGQAVVTFQAGTTLGQATVTATTGEITGSVRIEISDLAPVAAFSGHPTSGAAPLTVTFTDESTNYPTAWAWDFGDGGTSTDRNPQHTYHTAGVYDVTLTVTNTAGSNSLTRPGYIAVQEGQTGYGVYLPLVLRNN